MKKNSFIEGAMISTIGIILCKIIGIIYVIPFRAIIGVEGAVLYSYAYTIYSVFVSLSSSGIPSAMAKTISEYNTLGYYNAQKRAYRIGQALIVGIGLLCFLILFIFAPQLAYLIIGDIEGGNSIESITLVIRIISTALLFIPILSVSKGYVQGHRMMAVPAIANIIEQLVRVIVIVGGSFLTINVFHLSVTTAVGVAVFGATAGALAAYLYVLDRIKRNKKELLPNSKPKREELVYTNKVIAKKLIKYALPFILIEVIRSVYNTVDVFTIVKGLVGLGYPVSDAENILSIITTWGSKLNMIILSITIGLTISIVPNIVRSATLKDYKDVSHKINQSLELIMFIALPMTLGIWFLSDSIWTVFYGYDTLSVTIFSFYILQSIINSFFYVLIDINNALSNSKIALLTLVGSLIFKLVFNIPMMHLFQFLGLDAYYASIFVTMLSQGLAILFLLFVLKRRYKVSYKRLIVPFTKMIMINIIMMLVLSIMRLVLGEFDHTRMWALLEVILYGGVGAIVYFVIAYRQGLFDRVFGQEFANKIRRIFHLKVK